MEIVEIETHDGLQRVPLDKARITIGRLPGNDIVLPFTQISRHHAEIRQRGAEWWIIDLGSTNGLRVGGRQVKEHLLADGDRVILAPTIFLYFNGKRAAAPVTVEGSTVEMPVLADASAHRDPARPTTATAKSSAMLEPSITPADDLASIAAMPMPRRRMGMVPPPSANQPPGTSAVTPAAPMAPPMPNQFRGTPTPPAPPATPPHTEEQDLWLLAGTSGVFNPPSTTPLPPGSDAHTGNAASATPTGPELPLSSPFALLRQQHTPTHALPRRPILVSCPTCQASTAPDSPYCWSCHQTIARPCRQCGLFLLPIQSRCPRCAAANANAVKR